MEILGHDGGEFVTYAGVDFDLERLGLLSKGRDEGV